MLSYTSIYGASTPQGILDAIESLPEVNISLSDRIAIIHLLNKMDQIAYEYGYEQGFAAAETKNAEQAYNEGFKAAQVKFAPTGVND